MGIAERIRQKLEAAFQPRRLDVIDESSRHAGHAEAPSGGESHFRVVIVADAFADMTRLARQRAIHQALADELAGPVHALSIEARGPDES